MDYSLYMCMKKKRKEKNHINLNSQAKVKEILGTLDINSTLGFLISGVVNSLWPFLGQSEAPGGSQKVF